MAENVNEAAVESWLVVEGETVAAGAGHHVGVAKDDPDVMAIAAGRFGADIGGSRRRT